MENRSEIRRLDDAGRLIIPKAMRKILRWYSGDPILLTLHSRDSLLLHSYPRMLALRPLAADYADAFFATYQTPIAICDHERILVHRGFPLAGQLSLSEEARALLECGCADAKELPPLCLQHGSEAYAAAFIPIQPRHTTVGGILLGSCNSHTKDTLIGAGQLLARMIETQLIS